MSKLRKNTALIPFEAASGFLMVLIVAAMAFISCFALTASLMASKLADGWSDGLIGSATVRIDATAEGSAQRVADVLDILRTTDGITDARTLSAAEIVDLLEPWFGGIPELEGLPAPSIVAVKVDPEREPDPTLIQARLDGAGLFAVYDDHGAWRARAKDASETVRMIGWVSVVLAALAIAATVFVVVRIAMASHRETIAALRLTGAEDRFVAGLYQRRYLWLGFLGGLLGCALAVLVAFGLGAAARLGAALPALRIPEYWPFGLLGIIVFVVLLCVISARIAALTTLRLET